MKSRKKTPARKLSVKKPYRTPSLTVHGTLRQLTQGKGGMMNDSGMKPTTRVTAMGAA